MIDASSFALRHNAFWSNCAPTSEHFTRRINLEYTDRWCAPLSRPAEQIRAAFVAELAFSGFCEKLSGVPENIILEMIIPDTKRRLLPLLDEPSTLEDPLSKIEEQQILELQNNLSSYFKSRNRRTIVRPLLQGCGYIDSSEADIVSGNCLYEVKAVDRSFRGADIKQLITYCALNHLSGQFDLENIGVFNPRRGIYFELSINFVCYEISGKSKQALFNNIISAVSSGDISR